MSGFYLPGFFGRGAEVDADLAALVRILPDAANDFRPHMLPEVAAFVLEHGAPSPEERVELEALL